MISNAQLCALFCRSVNSGMMDFPRLTNLAYWLMRCENIPGDVCEFGSHVGHTAALLAAITQKQIWVFDSFKGLPAKSSHDITDPKFFEGALKSPQPVLEQTFSDAGLPKPNIVPKWFSEVGQHEMPHRIAFAHIDGDLHGSIRDSLRLVYPHLSRGAVCFIDDEPWSGLPGVKVALAEFLQGKPEKVVRFNGPCGALTQHCMFTKI